MLAIKNLLPHFFLQCGALIALCLLAGCTPPGPRALLQGDRLVEKGRYQEALEKLKTATELLPKEPRVWNCLGLAYQGLGDGPRAIEAYQHALMLDRSNLVFVARYNLGCAYLEQGNPAAAVNELRSYCLLSNSLPALLKLGAAELQTRQPDAAERSFSTALKLHPGDAAAQNGLGLALAQRNRPREAAQYFQGALKSDPKFGPALLNLAVLYHHQPPQKAYAAQKYREYLALEPRPANYETVKAVLARLDQELAPRVVPTNAVPHPPTVKTNGVPAKTNSIPAVTNLPVPPPTAVVTQRVAVPVATNIVPPVTNIPKPAVEVVKVPPPPVVVKTNVLVPAPPPPVVTSAPVPVVVVALSNPPPLKPAQDITPPPTRTNAAPPPVVSSNLWVVRAAPVKPAKQEKKSIFQSLNPFRTKEKPAATNIVVMPVLRPPEPAVTSAVITAVAPPPPVPRYTYLSPTKPAAGNRKAAEVFFQQGLKAHQEGRTTEAQSGYRAALEKDPAYFEAYYNLGLLAFQVSDWQAALHAYETALAVNPEAPEARLNLGLALDRADYPQDAAVELEKVARAKPGETRAHLTLGNLYAQKLGQTAKAREHYLKVLDLDPSHPQANAIRYWLAAHP